MVDAEWRTGTKDGVSTPLDELTDFTAFYETHFARIGRIAYSMVRNRQLAEDAAQEAFARAFERWSRLNGEPWAAGWVTSTTLNLLRRDARRKVWRLIPEAAYDPTAEVELWEAISRLPRRQQQAIVLRGAYEMSIRDMARAMECAEGTVKVQLHRARLTLRDELQEEA